MGILSLFKRKKKEVHPIFDHKGTLCPCYNGDWPSCIHPEAPILRRENRAVFKDDPNHYVIAGYCQYRMFCGPTAACLGTMTRAEYKEWIRIYTKCLHPNEYEERKDGN
jgi:hypothetical protein